MTPVKQLRSSCGEVERVCDLLLGPTPDALDDCSTVLEVAARSLAALRPSLHDSRGDAEALAEAWRLQRTVRRAGALLANAAAYHQQWQALVGVMTAGYGPGGHPAEAVQSGRLSLRG